MWCLRCVVVCFVVVFVCVVEFFLCCILIGNGVLLCDSVVVVG